MLSKCFYQSHVQQAVGNEVGNRLFILYSYTRADETNPAFVVGHHLSLRSAVGCTARIVLSSASTTRSLMPRRALSEYGLNITRNHSRHSEWRWWRWLRSGSWPRPAFRSASCGIKLHQRPVFITSPFFRLAFPSPGCSMHACMCPNPETEYYSPTTSRIASPTRLVARPRFACPPSGCGARRGMRRRGSGCSCYRPDAHALAASLSPLSLSPSLPLSLSLSRRLATR